MKVIIDTNVIISALYFGGKPGVILNAWKNHKFNICINQEILQEYHNTSERLSSKYKNISQHDVVQFLELLTTHTHIIPSLNTNIQICEDPNDDKFIYCALASGAKIIISGDRHLLDINGYQNIEILKPLNFITKYLK